MHVQQNVRKRGLWAAIAGGALSLAMLAGCTAGTGNDSAGPSNDSGKSESGAEPFGLSPVDSVTALVPSDLKGKALTIAIYTDGAPQQYLEGKKVVGIQPDFAQAVSEVSGLTFNVKGVGSWDSIIPGVQTGRYDAAFADFGITKERQEAFDLVFMFVTPTGFAVKEGSDLQLKEQDDLCGIKVATLNGSSFIPDIEEISAACVDGGHPAIEIQTYPAQTDALLAVSTGRAEAFANTNDQLAWAASQDGSGITVQPFEYNPVPMAIGVPNDSPLGPLFVEALKTLMEDGTYQKILDKWGISSAAITPEQVVIDPL